MFSDEAASSPTRRCIATGEVRDRARLLRFVVGPDGTIVPDIDERLPGRGLWLTPRRDIVDRAIAKRVFSRAARRQVSVSPDLADRLENLLARHILSTRSGLARRAGLAVAGFDRVGDAVRHGRAGLLLCARDGAAGGRRKLAELGRDLPCAEALTAFRAGCRVRPRPDCTRGSRRRKTLPAAACRSGEADRAACHLRPAASGTAARKTGTGRKLRRTEGRYRSA